MKQISLRLRISGLVGIVLLLCSVALTITASLNAQIQFTNVIPGTTGNIQYEMGTPIEGDLNAVTGREPRIDEESKLTEAKKQFNMVGVVALVVITVLGTGAVYLVTGSALKPVTELSEQAQTITQNNLHERVLDTGQADEVGMLCRSFNAMLDRLDHSFQQQKQFSANVAHELKTPLATMSASVQVLHLDQNPSAEDCKKMLSTIERNTNRLSAIVDDLMMLCNEEDRLETETIDLQKMFASIIAELAPGIAQKRLTTEINCTFPEVHGNSGLLYRAFFNLTENAVKYNQEGGSICISSLVEGAVGTIKITDTGIGIGPDELENIFEPFYRVSKSRSRKTGGAGLGLSVVKTIIERHGWSISVDSTLGEGSTFTVCFYLK